MILAQSAMPFIRAYAHANSARFCYLHDADDCRQWPVIPGDRTRAPISEALKAAAELVALISRDMVGQLGTQMASPIWPMMEPEVKGQIDAATMAELRREMDRHVLAQIDNLMKEWPPIYARHFTAAELHEIVAFNRSPTGQKALRLMPIVMAEFIKTVVPHMEEIQQKARQSTTRIPRARLHQMMKGSDKAFVQVRSCPAHSGFTLDGRS